MNLSDLADKEIIAGFLAGLGGLIRILLNTDKQIPVWKQFILLFVCSMPSGWLAYTAAISYGMEGAAFPIGFITGMMALSMATIAVKDGAGALFSFVIGRGK